MQYAYNDKGQLASIQTLGTDIRYDYDAQSQQLSRLTAVQADRNDSTIDYAYDGDLLTSVTTNLSTLNQSFTLGVAYNANWQVAGLRLGQFAYDISYNTDWQAEKIGQLQLHYHEKTGELQGSQVGKVNTAYTRNGFAELQSYQADFNGQALYAYRLQRDPLSGRIIGKSATVKRSKPATNMTTMTA